MKYQVDGVISQTLTLTLDQGEATWASHGSIVSLDEGVVWRVKLPGGVGGAFRRGLAGESLSLTRIESQRSGASVVLSGSHPGRIATWDLADGPVIATRGSFLAGVGEIDITVTIARRAGAAMFGGAGLLLQKITGQGLVFIHCAGDFLDRRLADGERLQVSTGNLAAFGAAVDYRIRGVGGCRRIFFGGEGLFMTELVGPGRALLQSLKRGSRGRPGAPG